MISNNGLTTCKHKWIYCINRGAIATLMCVLLLAIFPCAYLIFAYWTEMPIVIRIVAPVLLAIVFVGIITSILHGTILITNENIWFWADFRLKKFALKNLERIALVFSEWENEKYSVMVKFVDADGKVFKKDYSQQFRNLKSKKLSMCAYTITKRKVEKICKKVSDLIICVVTIVNKDRNVTYQNN